MDKCQEKLKELRIRQGWAQEDVAREIGVSLSTVQRWERQGGKPSRLARRELRKLFEEVRVEWDDNPQ
jgi:transcriptional regulator with XRE-family HTH domain